MLEPFNISAKRLFGMYNPIHEMWPDMEPDVFIDYQKDGKDGYFVFGYDSSDPQPTELIAIIYRDKAIRILAANKYPPHIERVRKNEWVVMFNNYTIMKQTIFVDVTLDDALCSAINYIIDIQGKRKK